MVFKSVYHFDFRDIIFELEKVDDMEFNIVSPSPLNEKVLYYSLGLHWLNRFQKIASFQTNQLFPITSRFCVRSGAN